MIKQHTIYLPGDGADVPDTLNAIGTEIRNFYGTKLEGVIGFKIEPSVGDPSFTATITLRVPVRIVYKDAK